MDPSGQQVNLEISQPTGLRSCAAVLVNLLVKGTAGLVAPHGLIPLEFTLLRLFLGSEQWTVTQLAQALPVKISHTSRVVTKLVAMGLMNRRRLTVDRRVVLLTLTGEGKTLTINMHRTVHDYEAVISQGVSEEEMAVFAAVTAKIRGNYAALTSPGVKP